MSTTITPLSILLLLTVASSAAAQNFDAPPPPYGFANSNFNPSMAIIIVVLISAFFFMGFFSIYIRQCAGGPADQPVTTITVGRSRRRKGLDAAVIETFPTLIYSVVKELKIGKETLECAVCLNEFEDDETLRLLPKCDHVFHPECIDAWLASHVTCPVCRANLVPETTEAINTTAADPVVSDRTSSDSDNHTDNNNENRNESITSEVSIRVTDELSTSSRRHPDVVHLDQISFKNRPARSGSSRRNRLKFPRSHSTGHSVVQPGENCERFTLRLPEEIRKKIVNGKLNRTTSCVAFPAGYEAGGSSRRGYRGGSVNEGKYNKFWRLEPAAKSERWAAPARVYEGEGSSRGSKFLTSVKSLKRYMSFKNDGKDGKESRPAV